MSYTAASIVPSGTAVALTHRIRSRRGVEATLGVRWITGSALPANGRAEGFLGLALSPRFGPWIPAVGIEAGLSAANEAIIGEARAAPGSVYRGSVDISLFYVAINASPFRFQFGPLAILLAGLSVGTAIPEPGRAFRLYLSLVRLEWRI